MRHFDWHKDTQYVWCWRFQGSWYVAHDDCSGSNKVTHDYAEALTYLQSLARYLGDLS